MELLCSTNNQDDNSNDSGDTATPNDSKPTNLPQGPHSGSSVGEHEDQDSPIGGPPYLTPSESKLFATTASGFNFTMAALAAETSGLGSEYSHFMTETLPPLRAKPRVLMFVERTSGPQVQ